jgi:hypothetical protein
MRRNVNVFLIEIVWQKNFVEVILKIVNAKRKMEGIGVQLLPAIQLRFG